MKKGLMLAMSLFMFSGFLVTASAAENNTDLSNDLSKTVVLNKIMDEPLDNSNIEKQPRIGYKWRCRGCDKVGHWQALYSIASKHAIAHTARTGHVTCVIGV